MAILLLSSFSVVIGMYWQHLLSHQKNVTLRLKALMLAAEIVDESLYNEANFIGSVIEAKNFSVAIDKKTIAKPRIVKGVMSELDTPYQACITISWHSGFESLTTLGSEQI